MKYIFCIMLISVLFAACKKDNNNTCSSGLPTKKTVILPNANLEYKYFFRSDGKIDSIFFSLGSFKFSYEGSTITRFCPKTFFDRSFKYVYQCNSTGMVIKDTYSQYDKDGKEEPSAGSTTTYEYNGTQLIKKITTYANMNTAIEVTVYQWQNGNVISATATQGTKVYSRTYTYYEDKPFQPGDDFFMDNVENYGNAGFTIKNKNLVKNNNEYTFDNNGKIIARIVRGENNTALFDYSCN